MGVNEADKLEFNPNVKTVETDVDGLYYIMGANLSLSQKAIGIGGKRIPDMPDDVVFFTTRQLKALLRDIPQLLETYC